MTRLPKTPRTAFERKWFDFHTELHDPAPLGYRRQPKGKRRKSGQWWKRPRLLRMSEIQSTNYPWQTRKNKP